MFLTSLIPMPESFAQLMSELIDGGPLIFIMVAIMAPLLEEFIFRGVLLDSFLKRSSPATAIIVSAVIFGLAHLNPWQFIVAFNMGLVAGWLYYRTRSILPGIAIHFINNAGVSLLFNDSAPAENIIGELGTGLTVILLLASGAILLTSFVYLREKLPAAGQWKEEEVELPFSDTYKGVLDT